MSIVITVKLRVTVRENAGLNPSGFVVSYVAWRMIMIRHTVLGMRMKVLVLKTGGWIAVTLLIWFLTEFSHVISVISKCAAARPGERWV